MSMYAPLLARLIKGDDKAIWDELTADTKWGYSYWDTIYPNKVKENKMSAVVEAKTLLESIKPGEWYAYTYDYNTKDYKQMIGDVENSLKKGDPYRISGVAIRDEPWQICTTGNGQRSIDHANFIAETPRLIQELLNDQSYLQERNDRQSVMLTKRDKKIEELEAKLKEFEDRPELFWFRPNSKAILNVRGKERMDKRLQLLEGAQNIFPEMDTTHKLIVENGVAYVMMRRDDYSEELKNAAIENTRRTIRQINKRHEAEVAEMQKTLDEALDLSEEYQQALSEGQSLTVLEARIKELEIDPKSGEYLKAVQRFTRSEKWYYEVSARNTRLENRLNDANKRIKELENNAVEQDDLIHEHRKTINSHFKSLCIARKTIVEQRNEIEIMRRDGK